MIPYDADAEECVIGACIQSPSVLEIIIDKLVATDFYLPANADAFAVIVELHRQGLPIDTLTVTDMMRRSGTVRDDTQAVLIGYVANTPATSSIRRYADIVASKALARQLLHFGTDTVAAMQDPTVDPASHLEQLKASLGGIDSPAILREPEDMLVQEFLDQPPEMRAPWVIPGILRADWRAVLVADEGVGKSVLLTQIAVMASWGIQPFGLGPMTPAKVLLVDLENPADVVHERLKRVTDACRAFNVRSIETPAAWLWHRPGGIDVRKRSQRLELEDVLRRRRPDLVVLGPVYKCYTRLGRESDEQVAAEVQAVLDDLRTRYAFALVLEHHAPKSQGGRRELVPFGSSLWLRWSELGFSLVRPNRDFPALSLRIESYRGDRVGHSWPNELQRGRVWPWEGRWDEAGGAFA